jgi:hypothetical protein
VLKYRPWHQISVRARRTLAHATREVLSGKSPTTPALGICVLYVSVCVVHPVGALPQSIA